ncbi:dipeptide/oligopeptide/nickel ABC transporter permease/ATP-binding protein [Amycolatopsis jejuensis]|uniref:dipeptide/oligopeptide/nickel ABC transporter permease/ATP-binding protein n=1 Tax=Amycolatopsis jejuensis TaxID=330084 RepID=UPI00068D3630|nr:dipeptide/oligopeptide/nickel ABC transporter permease/ATP-binding protein [Amycolatopsis jejuensis]
MTTFRARIGSLGPRQVFLLFLVFGWLLFLAVAPEVLGSMATHLDPAQARLGPSVQHPLGTDTFGRDILIRTIAAGRNSIAFALLATALGAVLGTVAGAVVSVLPPALRGLLMRGIDLAVSFPPLILAVLLIAILGVGTTSAVIAVALAIAPEFARTVATISASLGGREFMVALRLLTVPRGRLIARHLVPNMSATLIILTSVTASGSLIALAGLSFLGLGSPATTGAGDWGTMLTAGIAEMFGNPIAPVGPAAGIVITGLALNALGERLAAMADPRRRGPSRRTEPDARPVRQLTGPADANTQIAAANLRVTYGRAVAVADVTVGLTPGERCGIVGESGSGKSTLALALAGLLPARAGLSASALTFRGRSALGCSRKDDPRFFRVAYVPQDPSTSFNPMLRVGTQLTEGLRRHRHLGRRAAVARATSELGRVALDAPQQRMRQRPHELSGGMRQRALLAMALAGDPELLIADEPTTALDVTVQASILELLVDLNEERNLTLLLISHDISVIAQVCRRVLVMYRGTVVEQGPAETVLSAPAHPYTRQLISSAPAIDTPLGAAEDLEQAEPTPDLDSHGCPFRHACPVAMPDCASWEPRPLPVTPDHSSACLRVAEKSAPLTRRGGVA